MTIQTKSVSNSKLKSSQKNRKTKENLSGKARSSSLHKLKKFWKYFFVREKDKSRGGIGVGGMHIERKQFSLLSMCRLLIGRLFTLLATRRRWLITVEAVSL
jgi:hypothetical protein